MEKQTIYLALLFAAVAAVGNALFVFGQRKSAIVDHPFIFIIGSASVPGPIFGHFSFSTET